MLESSRMVELTALVAYLAVLLWIGLSSARRIRTSTDYTLAGRNVPWVVLLATTAATMIGGGASVGTVSRVYEIGVAAALITCAWHLQLIFTGLWAAPRLRRLNLVTVADFFELRFGRVARAMATAHCLLFLVGALVAQMAAMATITASTAGIPYGAALLIGAAVTIFYSTVGGMRAVVATDVLQFVILVGGMAAASGMLIFQQGGFLPLAEQVGAAHFQITGHWSVTGAVSLFVAFLLGEMFIPTYTVRCFIARDPRQARLGVAGSGLFLLLFLPMATFVMGISAAAQPEVQQAAGEGVQQVFPALVRTTFHPAFAGIMIAAMTAAAMSSADSVLSCNATVVMQDIYRRYINPRAPDRALLRVAEWTTLGTGIAAALLAYLYQDIISVLVFVYDFWAPAMVLPFLVGLFWYRADRAPAVVAAMAAGSAATILWLWLDSPGDVGAALFGVAVALGVFLLALPFTRRRRPVG